MKRTPGNINVFVFNAGSNITSLGEFQFDVEPRDYTAVKDSSAAFDCTVRSTSDVEIDWLKDGAPVTYDNRRYIFDLTYDCLSCLPDIKFVPIEYRLIFVSPFISRHIYYLKC